MRDGDSGKKCTVIYMYLKTTKMEIEMESYNPIRLLQKSKDFLQKPNLLKNQIYLGTKQGVFQKKETKCYLNKIFKEVCYKY